MASDLLGIAVTGLKTSQAQISTTGNNITNASKEGYTRQRVDLGTNPALYTGAGYAGSGVHVESIKRLSNQFLTTQIRLDTTAYSELNSFNQKVSEIDKLLSNEAVGLSGGLSSFFKSLQAATDDPTSIPVRQLILAQSDVLSQRFNSLYGRFTETNNIINQELGATATVVTSLSKSLANLNAAIVDAQGVGSGAVPNDLLDEREETLRQLSELVSVTTFEQDDGAVNVFIGKGQPLVIGEVATEVRAVSGQGDPNRHDIAFVSEGREQIITAEISGGALGGLLDFRDNVLDRSFNELGRVALAISQTINDQQEIGLDLNGNFGVPLFGDINERNSMLDRVTSDKTNANPPDRVVSVEITDATLLENYDYTLSLSGTGPDAFELRRIPEGTLVHSGGLSAQRPTSIEYGGFSISVEEGSFADGDKFRIMPTRNASRDVSVVATSPEVLAFALPVTTSNSLANSGTGEISQGDVLATRDPQTGELLPAFADLGKLSPPLVVRFTSETTYDILDASDPANPKSLVPPIENQTFIPGKSNSIFPSEPGQTIVASDGFNSNRIPRQTEIVSGGVGTQAPNTILDEQLTITYRDPATGVESRQPALVINQGDSAQLIAAQLSSRSGVTASAYTETQIRVVDNGAAGATDFTLYLNGININDELAILLSPQTVPVPVTNDLIADAINSSGALKAQDIAAVSNGDSIKITARSGVNLAFAVEGDNGPAGDFIEIKGDLTPIARTTQVVTGGVNLDAGGPNNFVIDLFDGPNGISNPKTINIQGSFTDPESLISYLENEINIAYDVPGKVDIELRDDGTLNFVSTSSRPQTRMQIVSAGPSDPLGLAAAVSENVIQPTDILRVEGTGAVGAVNAATVGGDVTVTLEDGFSLTSDSIHAGNLFKPEPQSYSKFTGYTFEISGNPDAGDEFFVSFNEDGVSDNRNALKFGELESSQLIGGNASFQESYGNLVEFVGTLAGESKINKEAAKEILDQSTGLRNSISGVNLDEEAADLIRFELAYNASSRIVSIARELFNSLLSAF